MTDIPRLVPSLPRDPDGFHVAIDAARERGDIILDRPPLNIITMLQREPIMGQRITHGVVQVNGVADWCRFRWHLH
jgi:hypothetical protein